MSYKKMIVMIAVLIIIYFTLMLVAFKDHSKTKLDMIEINDIVETLSEEWDTIDENTLQGLDYGLDYVVLDNSGNLLYVTPGDFFTDFNSSIINRDTILDIKKEDILLGKLIIHNNSHQLWQQYKRNLIISSAISMVITAVISSLYLLYLNKRIIQPFKKLQHFAKLIAQGNLDIPLEMDKGNLFGAFTESFDLMREELNKARENERKANQSKKELVASLSHDIKTPISSIKAVVEMMQVKSNDKYMQKQLANINMKADQINELITNMFNATLEELQELKVNNSEVESKVLTKLIKSADYNQQVKLFCKAEGIVQMDELRLSQVIDNIISNSYKYANTKIDVTIDIQGSYLIVSFKDYGKGVMKDELPFLFNKYYRAGNSEGKSGTGLGLYISKFLMNKMAGDIECEQAVDGFIVHVKLLLV